MSNLDVALRCAHAGLHVFPVTPDSRKRPTVRGSWREYSTTDDATIRTWWRVRASHLPAIDLHKAGLLVLDGDRHPDDNGEIIDDGVETLRSLFRKHRSDVKLNPVARTPSGGVHVYFKCPPGFGNREGDLPAGINVRGSGGYVVAPGSIRPDGKSYVPGKLDLLDAFQQGNIPPLPDWLCKIIRPDRPLHSVVDISVVPEPIGPIKITPGRCGRREQAYARKALEGNARQLAGMAPETGRNNALNHLTFRLATLAARGWLNPSDIERTMFDAATACGLVRDTGRKAVNNTLQSAITAGLKHRAADLKDRS
jgi:hypothetical protein